MISSNTRLLDPGWTELPLGYQGYTVYLNAAKRAVAIEREGRLVDAPCVIVSLVLDTLREELS